MPKRPESPPPVRPPSPSFEELYPDIHIGARRLPISTVQNSSMQPQTENASTSIEYSSDDDCSGASGDGSDPLSRLLPQIQQYAKSDQPLGNSAILTLSAHSFAEDEESLTKLNEESLMHQLLKELMPDLTYCEIHALFPTNITIQNLITTEIISSWKAPAGNTLQILNCYVRGGNFLTALKSYRQEHKK